MITTIQLSSFFHRKTGLSNLHTWRCQVNYSNKNKTEVKDTPEMIEDNEKRWTEHVEGFQDNFQDGLKLQDGVKAQDKGYTEKNYNMFINCCQTSHFCLSCTTGNCPLSWPRVLVH